MGDIFLVIFSAGIWAAAYFIGKDAGYKEALLKLTNGQMRITINQFNDPPERNPL